MVLGAWVIAFLAGWGGLLGQATPPPKDPPSQAPVDPPAQEPEKKSSQAPPDISLDQGASVYPMPSIAADKDSGATYGILVALMFTNDHGIQDTLLSGTVDYNRLVKWSGEVELRYYPDITGSVDIDGYYAQKVENSLHLFYEETKLENTYHLRLESFDFRSTTDRFFGIGDGNPKSAESVHTSNEYRAEGRFGPRLTEYWDVEGTVRWRRFRASDSLITDLPQTTVLYPTVPGIEGGQILAGGLRFVFDSRDSITTPVKGTFANFYFESAHDYAPNATHAYWNAGGSQVTLIPMDEDSAFVTVINTATQIAVGGFIPFWEMPSLGGGWTLRSYNGNRFVNKGMILLNVEERIRIWRTSLFGISGDVQVAPFVDVGKVFDSSDDLVGRGILQEYHYSYGVGFRGVVKPSFVGRFDIGFGGREGVGFWVGLDYPF